MRENNVFPGKIEEIWRNDLPVSHLALNAGMGSALWDLDTITDLVPSPMSCALHSISLLDKIHFVLFHFISFFLHSCLVFYFMVFLG